jgi:hypothetical protein
MSNDHAHEKYQEHLITNDCYLVYLTEGNTVLHYIKCILIVMFCTRHFVYENKHYVKLYNWSLHFDSDFTIYFIILYYKVKYRKKQEDFKQKI